MPEKNEFNQIVDIAIENWRPVEKPPKTSLYGIYCVLEPLDLGKHTTPLFDSLQRDNRGESWTYLPYGPFKTCDEFHHWLQATASDNDTLLYVILDSKTHIPIGICGYLRINPEHGVIEVGHLHYSKFLKRTAVATEAMYLMMYQVFEKLGYRRYEWKCNALNQASRKAAERLGFKFEGIFRQHYVFKNRNRDTAWFSIIDSEWPEIKARFQRWLSPSNFDKDSKQSLSLREI